jgi:hypothetical protein
MMSIISTRGIFLKNKSKAALIIGLSVVGLTIYNRELIWLNLGRNTEVVKIISTKNANNYVNEREQVFDIGIQKYDSSTETLKLEYSWWSLAGRSYESMYPELTKISETKECVRIKIYGMNIPHISKRQIYDFQEVQCPFVVK